MRGVLTRPAAAAVSPPPSPHHQALSKLAPHIQQVSMESNGKGVDIDGNVLPFEAGA